MIRLERTAEEERARLAGLTGDAYDAQRRRFCTASDAVRAAITARAEATGADPSEVEQAVRRAVRQAQEDPAVE
ncbi:hypothetical protein GT045_30570 [Streptomyces sp. SID486]|nr:MULTISPECIES: hypothetical protein [unclassified Streptomyces]MYW16505.1 hypothetical protein [Streptomyces sp. SID2955]MYW47920.1 hypothetical protein [Streptomyces sp. SID161]MYX96334.1 hypothetical protein [Streptomyces sp. SID486]MYX99028.1 hypothetical protein [Streptomyces sp. SID486]